MTFSPLQPQIYNSFHLATSFKVLWRILDYNLKYKFAKKEKKKKGKKSIP